MILDISGLLSKSNTLGKSLKTTMFISNPTARNEGYQPDISRISRPFVHRILSSLLGCNYKIFCRQEAELRLSLAEDIPVLEADELVESEMSGGAANTASAASASVVQAAEPAQVAVVQETEAEHSAVELHTEQSQVAVVREPEPTQVAVVLQTEAAHAAAVLEAKPAQVAAAAAVVMESPPAQVAVVSQSPPQSSTATLDESVDDGMAALKARALIEFAKRSAEYLEEERQEEVRARAAPLPLPRRTRMQPARAALHNMAVTPSVFDAASSTPNPSQSFFFGTRSTGRAVSHHQLILFCRDFKTHSCFQICALFAKGCHC